MSATVGGGRLYVGTSGFSYPAWAPRFYRPATRSADLLREYGARLPAVELNNTFYRQPRPDAVASWLSPNRLASISTNSVRFRAGFCSCTQ